MLDPATAALCVRTVRAAIARTISKLEQLPIADARLAEQADLVGVPHLSLVQFDQLGYPMGDAIIPLIELAGGATDGPADDTEGITRFDQLMDDTRAHLHDRLLNLSAPFGREVSVAFDNAVLNVEYEEVLRTAQFAGRLQSDLDAVTAARELLFPGGMPSEALIRYDEFAAQVDELRLAVEAARTGGEATTVERLERQARRVRVEWSTLGRKDEIERAFATLDTADADAGFEDERTRFLDILLARKRARLSSALDYATVNLFPLSALIDAEEQSHWTSIRLDGDELRAVLDPAALERFELTAEQIEPALELVSAVEIEYARVHLDREWLQQDFLTAPYWRHAETVLSDGRGGGVAPTVASSAIFVRAASFDVAEFSAHEGVATQPTETREVRLHQAAATPLITMVADDTAANAALVRRLPPAQTLQLTNVVDVRVRDHRREVDLQSVGAMSAGGSNRPRPRPRPAATAIAARAPHFAAQIIDAVGIRATRFGDALSTVPVPRPPRPRPGDGPPRPRPTKIVLSVDGRVALPDGMTRDDVSVTVQLHAASKPEPRVLPLREIDGNTVAFGQRVNREDDRLGRITAATFRLQLADGTVLIEETANVRKRSSKRTLQWSVRATTGTFELTSRSDPTLMAYGLEILPKCPNPDDGLVWE